MANVNELMNGWGFGKQADILTANTLAKIWRHTNLNTKPWAKVPVNEDDRAEIGKGHEFPTQLFKSHYNMPTFEISKYASSEFLAWAMAFSLGNVVLTGTGPYQYVIVPALGATNPTGLELPYFSFVQQIRPGGSAILDEILVGCAIKGWKLSIKNSPGRASAMCSVECVATGQYTSPSGITLPAATTPHEFNAGMVTMLTLNGVNYLTGGSGKQFVSMDASWENNFRPGFFPGSGTQDGYQIQGRFEFGDRVFAVQFDSEDGVQRGVTGEHRWHRDSPDHGCATLRCHQWPADGDRYHPSERRLSVSRAGPIVRRPRVRSLAPAPKSSEDIWKRRRRRYSMLQSLLWCRSYREERSNAKCASRRTRSGAVGPAPKGR